MPKIDFANHVPGVDPRLPGIPRRLTGLGIDVPKELSDAIAAGRWRFAAPDLDALNAALAAAGTEDAFRKAADDLAAAYVRADAMRGPEFVNDVNRARSRRVFSAFRDAVPVVYAGLATVYTRTDFADAVAGIALDSMAADSFSLGPDQAALIQRAKTAAATVSEVLSVYAETARLSGWSGLTGRGALEAEEVACRLGEYDSLAEFAAAADLVQAFANDRGAYDPGVEAVHPDLRRVRFSVFSPAAAVVLAGGRLVLSDPRVAADRADAWRTERDKTARFTGTGEGRIPV